MATLATFGSGIFEKGSLIGKSSITNAEPFFGGLDGKVIATPSFTFGEGTLSRTSGEFLNEQRRSLADLRANRARFGEGFTESRRARLQEVENARARTVGNLRSQLGRRGILGASFAGDAITRTELDFQQQKDKVAAEIDVQEFAFNLQNLAQESQIAQANLARELKELELSLDFVSNINNAMVARDRIAAAIEIARFQRRRGNSIRNFNRFGPGGPLGSFPVGSPTRGFRGSTGTTATSTAFTTQGASIPSTGPFIIGGSTPFGAAG